MEPAGPSHTASSSAGQGLLGHCHPCDWLFVICNSHQVNMDLLEDASRSLLNLTLSPLQHPRVPQGIS